MVAVDLDPDPTSNECRGYDAVEKNAGKPCVENAQRFRDSQKVRTLRSNRPDSKRAGETRTNTATAVLFPNLIAPVVLLA